MYTIELAPKLCYYSFECSHYSFIEVDPHSVFVNCLFFNNDDDTYLTWEIVIYWLELSYLTGSETCFLFILGVFGDLFMSLLLRVSLAFFGSGGGVGVGAFELCLCARV